MVSPAYLFIGQDTPSKDTRLKALRQELLTKEVEEFNLDILSGRELNLKVLQEKLLCLPINSKKRLVVIRQADALSAEIKEFLANYLKKPLPAIVLVLDLDRYQPKDEFINRVYRYAQVLRFKEEIPPNTFTLGRFIDAKKTDYALRTLNQLLTSGEKPERIMGGLRYAWEKNTGSSLELRRRLRLLLNCDAEIKTGRLKPQLALERFVVRLCAFR